METASVATPPPPRSRSARRSVPNLGKLTIGPLSSEPLEPAETSPTDPTTPSRASYIQGKSAPTTPGILSLSQSRSSSRQRRHRNNKQTYGHDDFFTTSTQPPSPEDPSLLSTAKSAISLSLNPILDSHGRVKPPGDPKPTRPHHKRSHTLQPVSTDWLHRAGIAIASDSREQKGQAWLASRESSTSLAALSPDVEHARAMDELLRAADTRDPQTPRWSRAGSRTGSRTGSRVASALNSRRGSRVGSRVDFTSLTAAGTKTPTDRAHFDRAGFEPDFVDADEEGDGPTDGEDEKEVARLTREQSLGLGGWVDRLVGWTLFRVAEDGEDNESEEEEEDEPEENSADKAALRKLQEADAVRRRRERELINAASAKANAAASTAAEQVDILDRPAPQQAEGTWQDAAWLLSVASKVLL